MLTTTVAARRSNASHGVSHVHAATTGTAASPTTMVCRTTIDTAVTAMRQCAPASEPRIAVGESLIAQIL